jgi:N-acetylglucosaminyldiphosphoundecaprenol N-acetyl-beta-D-mannosaminyltransferase
VQFLVGSEAIVVNMATLGQLEEDVWNRWNRGEGFALATLNLDHLAKLPGDAAFRRAYLAQDLVTADGNPIVWMARVARQRLDLLPGSDLILPLARLALRANMPLGLIGTTANSLSLAALALQQAVPGVRIVAQIAPPMGFDPQSAVADAMLAELDSAGVRLCFVALGAPKQEIFAARGRQRTPLIGFASIGAGLDFLSGNQTRAPGWVRRFALEWLWRLMSDPRRLAGRYWRAAQILPGQLLASWQQR